MSLDRLGRWQMPVIALLAMLVALSVAAGILLVGGIPDAVDNSPTASASASPSGSESPGDTPESAVRAFFEAFAEARETSDPSLIEPYVNGTDSDAYRTAAGFLEGQRGLGKASVVTVQELTDFEREIEGSRATVRFSLREGGYDIDLESGEPLETPVVLPERRVRAELVQVDGTWLLDGYGATE